jgi:type II secretory pathway pseudopilin PulG
MQTNRQHRKHEAGYTLVAVMIGIAIVSMALVGHAMLAGVGALASRKARGDHSCRAAALARLHDVVPTVDGGSVPPSAAEPGWSDTVYFDPATGSIVAVGSEQPSGASLVSRQWRRGRDAGGRPIFEVVATAVDGTGLPLAGRLAASVTYSERVR